MSFSRRAYFHGGERDYDSLLAYIDNAKGEHVKTTHLSPTLESPAGGLLWAVSAPVFDEKGDFVGVVGLRVKIGDAPDALLDPN